ncbi:MAG: Flp pilus assembly protein CpaB [Syntrophobacteraceae bacterium]
MRGSKGIVTLVLAALLGLAAVKAVSVYLDSASSGKRAPASAPVEREAAPKPLTFAESIPDGMRAVSIKVDDVTGVSRKVSKGDFVDVLATAPMPGSKEASVARIILERVKVLDVATESEAKPQGRMKDRKEWTVTLLVAPPEGVALVAAAAQAEISLLARRADDALSEAAKDAAFTREEGRAKLLKPASDVTQWVRPGMRAVTTLVRDTDGACGLLHRGDRVDVIVTCPFSRFSTSSGAAEGAEGTVTQYSMRSLTLLQNVKVLANEKSFTLSTDQSEPVAKVTLEVTPQDAERMAVAMDATEKSIIRLVLRGRGDGEIAKTHGQELAELLTEKKEETRVDVYKGVKSAIKVSVKPFFKDAAHNGEE